MGNKAEYQENNKEKPRKKFSKHLKLDKMSKIYAALGIANKVQRNAYIRSQCLNIETTANKMRFAKTEKFAKDKPTGGAE